MFYLFTANYLNVQQSNVEMNDPLSVIDDVQDTMPVMEGVIVSFRCCFEFILTGPNSSTCMRNGEWEPDPSSLYIASAIWLCKYFSQEVLICNNGRE